MDSFTISVIAIVISVFSAISSTYFTIEANRRSRKNLEIDYHLKIQSWADRVIVSISEAFILGEFEDDKDFERQRIKVMSDLTALLDQGRMFFPNVDADWGKEKSIAFQGIRHEVLDPIKASFDLVKKMKGLDREKRSNMSELFFRRRQEFVSLVHKELSPTERNLFFKYLSAKKL